MLSKMITVREALEKAVEMEVPGSATALLDWKDIHSQVLVLKEACDELQNELEDKALDSGEIAHG